MTYLVFARYPEVKKVKTRLMATLGAEGAAQLYEAMLLDTLDCLALRGADIVIFLEPGEKLEAFAEWLAGQKFPSYPILPQQGETLGDKMYNAFVWAEKRNKPAFIIGTDSPTIPSEFLDTAEKLLSDDAAVLGGTEDGGFYLMGLPEARRNIFFGGDYSNDTVFARTHAALKTYFPKVFVIPPWYDIDNETSLIRLREEFSSGEHVCRRTQSVLRLSAPRFRT